MKKLCLLSLVATLSAVSSAQSLDGATLTTPSLRIDNASRFALAPARMGTEAHGDLADFSPTLALQSDSAKKGQVWVLLVSYEKFSGDKAGDEFGFTPTGGLGYQRNFYPNGRIKNSVGYSLGVGVVGAGAAIYYHQGSANRVDFRVGLALDVIFFNSIYGSSIGGGPFLQWGIKV